MYFAHSSACYNIRWNFLKSYSTTHWHVIWKEAVTNTSSLRQYYQVLKTSKTMVSPFSAPISSSRRQRLFPRGNYFHPSDNVEIISSTCSSPHEARVTARDSRYVFNIKYLRNVRQVIALDSLRVGTKQILCVVWREARGRRDEANVCSELAF